MRAGEAPRRDAERVRGDRPAATSATDPDGPIEVVVTRALEIATSIRCLHLARADGSPLPPFSGGSHLLVETRVGGTPRRTPYSLSGSPLDTSGYRISVRRDARGRGVSRHLHDAVGPGTRLRIGHPANLFPLALRARRHLMVAGGIGITPFVAQTAQLLAWGGEFELHYAVRSRASAAHLDELAARLGGRLHVHVGEAGERVELGRLLRRQPSGTHLYVCGPASLIAHARERAAAAGWPDTHVHVERFVGAPPGEPFRVELRASGRTLTVGPDESLLEAIERAGIDAPSLCRGGVCGRCETRVLARDAELLHADHWLDPAARAAGRRIMPCVSRCRGGTLVLDR